jgi:hypothetical protein
LQALPYANGSRPVRSQVGLYSLTGMGQYASISQFEPADGQTEITYELNLQASLPVPLAFRVAPEGVVTAIANSITQWRMEETADGFIQRSIHAFQAQTAPTAQA